MKNFIKNNKIKIFTLLLISFLAILRIAMEGKPYATGDAVEYTIVTEAFYNHLSPDVRASDFESFKEAYKKNNKWEENDKAKSYDQAENFIAENNHKNLDSRYAFFVDKDGKKYSVHFFFYSLLNLPMRSVCALIGFNPLLVCEFTNVLLLLITCFLFFKYSRFKEIETAIFILLFFYSTNYWYLTWQHTEVFTVCFVSLGLWLYLSGKDYIGLFLISVAALQNQPIAIVVGTLFFVTLFRNNFTIKNLLKLGCSSFLVFIPSLFYYYHFGESNLVKYQGALSFDYVSFTRVFGFFFDINQGVILSLPFVLFLYLFLIIRKAYHLRSEKNKWEIIMPFALIGAVSIAATIDNWNHGQAVVNRYVTYISAFILVHTFYLVMQLESMRIKKTFLISSIVTQLATVYYHQSLSKYDWSTNIPKPISMWVLDKFPNCYNPDPIIFISRYYDKRAIFYPDMSPAYFMRPNGELTKILTHDQYLNNLEKFGFSKKQIDSLAPTLHYINHWAYVTVDDKLMKSLSASKIKLMDNERRMKEQIETIKNTPDWYKQIQEQAQKEGISEDDALRKNAAYVLGIEIAMPEQKEGMTVEEKIQYKINEIRSNASWLQLIDDKAKKQNISLDSAILIDAKWIIEEEIKK